MSSAVGGILVVWELDRRDSSLVKLAAEPDRAQEWADGRRSFMIVWSEGAAYEAADRFLRNFEGPGPSGPGPTRCWHACARPGRLGRTS
jgi:hypothetical protein